jgi:hypothetical protein
MLKSAQTTARNAVNGLLSTRGAVAVRQTAKEDIIRFLEKLRPVESGYGLTRLGGEGDGGYLIPNDLHEISACFSPGVSETSSFERDCAERGMALYLADYSVDHVGPELEGYPYQFTKRFIGPDPSPEFISFSQWIQSSNAPDGDWMLQMDIEGGEYPVLIEASLDDLKRFRVICVEFHQLTALWNEAFFAFVKLAFDRLLVNHVCVHVHPNNAGSLKKHNGIELPDLLEMTFLRRDRLPTTASWASLPHPLDAPNLPLQKDIAIRTLWD